MRFVYYDASKKRTSEIEHLTLPTFALDARLVGGTSTGDSSYWTGLLEGLIAIEPKAHFLLFSNAPQPATIPLPASFEWIHLRAKSQRWWSYVKFPLAARSRGAKAIHTQYSMSPLVGSCGITTIHDVSFFIGPEWFRAKNLAMLRTSVPASARRARTVIAVSNTCKGEIERFIPAATGKIEVVYNACPSWVQHRDHKDAKQNVARKFGIDTPYLLTVGTRWPRKNMELAVKATDLLPASIDHRLLVTGKTGWGDQEIGTRGVRLGYVTHDQLCDLYSAADLYLAPSKHEGFGIPLLEAFRCGAPVLCSSGGALPEVAGDAGVVQRSWEPADWAATIQTLLGDSSKLDELRRKGFEREKQFTWVEAARKTLSIYMGAMQ